MATGLRYWFAGNAEGEALILTREQSADDYKATGGWVQGPYVRASDYEGAVSLVDELADVLADVSVGLVGREDDRVMDALKRCVEHVNGAAALPSRDSEATK
jgi:hypothetical protein